MGQRFAKRHQFVETTGQPGELRQPSVRARCAARHSWPAAAPGAPMMGLQLIQALMQIEERPFVRRAAPTTISGNAAQPLDGIGASRAAGWPTARWHARRRWRVMRGNTWSPEISRPSSAACSAALFRSIVSRPMTTPAEVRPPMCRQLPSCKRRKWFSGAGRKWEHCSSPRTSRHSVRRRRRPCGRSRESPSPVADRRETDVQRLELADGHVHRAMKALR